MLSKREEGGPSDPPSLELTLGYYRREKLSVVVTPDVTLALLDFD